MARSFHKLVYLPVEELPTDTSLNTRHQCHLSGGEAEWHLIVIVQIITGVRFIFGTAKPDLAGDEADEIFDLEASIEGFDPVAEMLGGSEFQKL